MKRIVANLLFALLLTVLSLATRANDTCEDNSGSTGSANENINVDDDQMYNNLIEFIRSRGGYVNPGLVVQPVEPGASFRGIFVTHPIKEGEVLFSLPWSILLKPDDVEEIGREKYPVCRTVRSVIQEMKLGDKSEFAPYVRYLLSTPKVKLPCLWSKSGRSLLMDVSGPNRLPPDQHLVMYLLERWLDDCHGSLDAFETQAAMLTFSRESFDLMPPFYDMQNHHNGYKHNTVLDVYDGQELEETASRDISKGEQIYESYNFCNGCDGRMNGYGTPQLLCDYGFVESIPQRWPINDDIEFDLDYKDDSNELEVIWLTTHVPSLSDVAFLRGEVVRLEAIKKSSLSISNEDIPEHELEVTRQYVDAMLVALGHAISAADGVEGSLLEPFDDSEDDFDSYDDDLDEGWEEAY